MIWGPAPPADETSSGARSGGHAETVDQVISAHLPYSSRPDRRSGVVSTVRVGWSRSRPAFADAYGVAVAGPHAVTNQPPPLVGRDLLADDPALVEWVVRLGGGGAPPSPRAVWGLAGRAW